MMRCKRWEWGGISGTFSDFPLEFGYALTKNLLFDNRDLFAVTGFGYFSCITSLYSPVNQ